VDKLVQRVPSVSKERRVLLEPLDRADSRASLVIPDCQGLLDYQDLPVLMAGKAHKVSLDLKAP